MKHIFAFSLIFTFLTGFTFAQQKYTLEDVKTHNSVDDCWFVIEQKVYDVTSYLNEHKQRFDISPWCGTDATEEFNTKAGKGFGHSAVAKRMLNGFMVGELVSSSEATDSGEGTQPVSSVSQSIVDKPAPVAVGSTSSSPYNVWLPILLTIVAYFGTLKFIKRVHHNFLWNSVMLLGLVPSFIFGVLMASGYNLGISNITYYHVQYSIVFGTACVLHLLTRRASYLAQSMIFKKDLMTKDADNNADQSPKE